MYICLCCHFVIVCDLCEGISVYVLFVYKCIAIGDPVIIKGKASIRLSRWSVSHLPRRTCLKAGPSVNAILFCVCTVMWFIVRGDCSLCWYLWKCLSLIFKLSFHKSSLSLTTDTVTKNRYIFKLPKTSYNLTLYGCISYSSCTITNT